MAAQSIETLDSASPAAPRPTTFASPVSSEILRRLMAYWDRMRGDRPLPGRADFDPLDVRFALGHISLIEVHRDPMRFYFRLDGGKQVDLFGVDCTRRYLDEAMPGEHSVMAGASYREVVEKRAPRYHRRKIKFHERMIDYEVVILPLSTDGEIVDMLITGIVPDRPL